MLYTKQWLFSIMNNAKEFPNNAKECVLSIKDQLYTVT
jgi:hypothetical protein